MNEKPYPIVSILSLNEQAPNVRAPSAMADFFTSEFAILFILHCSLFLSGRKNRDQSSKKHGQNHHELPAAKEAIDLI